MNDVKLVTMDEAEDALRWLDIALKERAAQLKAVRTLYGAGLMEHAEVIKYTKAIKEFE